MSAVTAGPVHLLTLRLSNLCDAPSGASTRGTTEAADVTCGACLGKIAARMPGNGGALADDEAERADVLRMRREMAREAGDDPPGADPGDGSGPASQLHEFDCLEED